MIKTLNITLKKCFFLIPFLLRITVVNAQLTDISAAFKQYYSKAQPEKIYAQTDKNFYMTGEILWFKVYNIEEGSNKFPTVINSVAYADILDASNNPVLQAKVPLSNWTGDGSFYLPETLKNGNYKLRVYTSWMKNLSPDFFFEKTISVVNPLNTKPKELQAKAPVDTTYNIQFFAEGGNLINGVTSAIGFKAVNSSGNGVNVNGVIINGRNDTLAAFKSLKFGMGSFIFTPQAGETYKALVYSKTHNPITMRLPSISTAGYGLHLTSNGDKLQFNISVRKQSDKNENLYLIIHCGKQMNIIEEVTADTAGNATIVFNKDQLSKGINHITLFNSLKQPVCERLYFKRPDLLNLQLSAQQNYKIRSKASVNITALGANNKPQRPELGISVYKIDSLIRIDPDNIVGYLWLSSDLKGYIQSPQYYFERNDNETDFAIDNLLLTQGWSRFKWTDILNGPPKLSFARETNGHIINAQITDVNNKSAQGIDVFTAITKKEQLYGATSSYNGMLQFNTTNFYGPGEIVVQTNPEKDSTYNIKVLNPFSEKYSLNKPLSPLNLYKASKPWIESNSIDNQVQNIFSIDNLNQYHTAGIDTTAFFGSIYKRYTLDNYTQFTTIEEVLREYVPSVFVYKRKNRFSVKMLDSKVQLMNYEPPMAVVDGVPIFNLDKVFAMDPSKIKHFKIVNSEYINAPIKAGGIISFASYNGDIGGIELQKNAIIMDYEGLQFQREFYSPIYDTEMQQKSRLPDLRNVLCWKSDIDVDFQGKSSLSFYTSDREGKYVIVCQGITDDGLAGSSYVLFNVIK